VRVNTRRRVRRLCLGILVVSLLVAAVDVIPALANTQVGAVWESTTGDQGWLGSRVSVGTTDSSQRAVSSGDGFLTSAYADSGAGGSSLIQTGVLYEWNAGIEGPSCNLGSSGAALYYFVETEHLGVYHCYNKGYAASATTHKESVYFGSDGLWHSARDGADENVTTSWTGCNGHACTLIAFGENITGKAGKWQTKFAGSGNTPWQFMNSCCWFTINNAGFTSPPANWSGPTGPFPGGIWAYTYSK
jgi:hypothetical protein